MRKTYFFSCYAREPFSRMAFDTVKSMGAGWFYITKKVEIDGDPTEWDWRSLFEDGARYCTGAFIHPHLESDDA